MKPDPMDIAKEQRLMKTMLLTLPDKLNKAIRADVAKKRKDGLLATKETVIINILKKHYGHIK